MTSLKLYIICGMLAAASTLMAAPQGPPGPATTWFVSAAGSDFSAGTSAGSAWQTWDKVIVEAGAGTFSDGDTIRFQCGGVYTGSGGISTSLDLTLSSYGVGPRPHIQGDGTAPLFIFSAGSVSTVANLELTNNGALPTTSKIAQTGGAGTYVVISHCWMHAARNGVNSADGACTIVSGCLIEDIYLDGTSGNGTGAVLETVDCLLRRCGLAAAMDGNSTGDACTSHSTSINNVRRCIIVDCNKAITHVNTAGLSLVQDSIILMDDIQWSAGAGGQSPPWLRWGINQTTGGGMNIENVIVGLLGTQPLLCVNTSSGRSQEMGDCTFVHVNSNAASAIIGVTGANTLLNVRRCDFRVGSSSHLFWVSDGAAGQVHRTSTNAYSPVFFPTSAGAQFLSASAPISWDIWNVFTGEFSTVISPGSLPVNFQVGATPDTGFPFKALSMFNQP